MWNFEDKIQTNDIAEICELLKSYKGKWKTDYKSTI